MTGETDLQKLIKTLTTSLSADLYVFATLGGQKIPANLHPQMVFREAEGLTLILRKTEAESLAIAHEYDCRMITLNVHSALAAVGFLARIAQALTAQRIPSNVVSGFYHDHIFVPDGREQEALTVLNALSTEGLPTAGSRSGTY